MDILEAFISALLMVSLVVATVAGLITFIHYCIDNDKEFLLLSALFSFFVLLVTLLLLAEKG